MKTQVNKAKADRHGKNQGQKPTPQTPNQKTTTMDKAEGER
jgi:hypothetical protein